MNNKGIIFLNSGSKLLPRLITSLHSLRQHYQDNITILVIGNENNNLYEKIAAEYSTSVVNIDFNLKIRHHYWFEKSRLHLYTPYQNSIFLDSDTIVLNNFNELFDEIEKYDFIASQFAHWRSSGRTISKRLRQWSSTDRDWVEDTIKKDIPSVNMGLYGFKKSSELMQHWFDLTIKHPSASLPEETTCHLLLTKYKSKIVSHEYNCSCKHDNPNKSTTKVVHFHGRKHCRLDNDYKPKYNGEIWIKNWLEVFDNNVCNIQEWYRFCGDRYLKNLMRNIKKLKL